MTNEDLIQRIKDAGQEIIDRAEEIAAPDLKNNLSILLNFDLEEKCVDTIEWTTEVVIKNQLERLM